MFLNLFTFVLKQDTPDLQDMKYAKAAFQKYKSVSHFRVARNGKTLGNITRGTSWLVLFSRDLPQRANQPWQPEFDPRPSRTGRAGTDARGESAVIK